jgi:acetophenone carboxylase
VRIRLQELAKEKGTEFLVGLFAKMIKQTEDGVKAKIRDWNDGTYRHVTFFDTIGWDEGLIRVHTTVKKKGDRIFIDFTGTSPETEGSWNGFLHTAIAYSSVFLFGYPFHDLPVSSGIFRAIEWYAPRGCVLNANVDAAISNTVITCQNVWQGLAVCTSKMMFDSKDRELVGGMTGSAESGIIPSGVDQWGVPISDLMGYPLNTWGFGARLDKDGIDCAGFQTCPWGKGADVEDVETEQPHLFLSQKSVKDMCGHGKFRGGLSCETTLAVYAVPRFTYNSDGIESKIPSHGGVFGGYPGPVHPGIEIQNTNLMELLEKGDKRIPTNIHELVSERRIKGKYIFEHNVRRTRVYVRGDIFHQTNSCGGGYGDVLERDPELIIKDLKNQAISDWTARNIYFVDYDRDTLQVNYEKTKELREKERKNRIKRAKKYNEFVKTWSRKKPGPKILKYYGSWPNGEPNREIVRS